MSPWRRGLSFPQPQTRSSPRLLDNDFNDDDSNHVAQQRLPAMPSSTAAGAARADSDTGERRRSLLLPETGLVWHSIYQGAGSCLRSTHVRGYSVAAGEAALLASCV